MQDSLITTAGLLINILQAPAINPPCKAVFFKTSAGDLLTALRFLDELYNFCNFVVIFSLM